VSVVALVVVPAVLAAAAHAIVYHSACEHPYPTAFRNRLQVSQKLEVGDVFRLDLFPLNWIDLDDAKVPGYYLLCVKNK
jgi:hypothetical protein